jgi:hypothetical protein
MVKKYYNKINLLLQILLVLIFITLTAVATLTAYNIYAPIKTLAIITAIEVTIFIICCLITDD